MRRVQSKCRGMGPRRRLGMPIFFPFPAPDCRFQSGPTLAHFDTLLTPVFLITCDCPEACSNSTDAPGLCFRLFYPHKGATRKPKSDPFLCTYWPPPRPLAVSSVAANCLVLPAFELLRSHSKRRISTGNRRDAARAGSRVAPTEITIATTAIQTPSQTLG
jgi:hypothetical protein